MKSHRISTKTCKISPEYDWFRSLLYSFVFMGLVTTPLIINYGNSQDTLAGRRGGSSNLIMNL